MNYVFLVDDISGQRRAAAELFGPTVGASGRDHSQLGRLLHEDRHEDNARYGAKGHYVFDR